jgi:hypothetical protein
LESTALDGSTPVSWGDRNPWWVLANVCKVLVINKALEPIRAQVDEIKASGPWAGHYTIFHSCYRDAASRDGI